MKLILKSLCLTILLCLVMIVMAFLVSLTKHERLLNVESDNLPSTFQPGDLVLMKTNQPILVMPHGGQALNFLRKPIVLIGAVYLPTIVVAELELRRLQLAYTGTGYSARLEA